MRQLDSTTAPIPAMAVAILATALFTTTASATQDRSPSVWMTSAELGVGPVDDEMFVHLTPRLTHLRTVPTPFCDDADCRTYLETSAHVPLRLRATGREEGLIRRRDWSEASDFFRILRRVEYGTPAENAHLRAGEIGPVDLGHGTIVNGYYNVVTTDHYRLGAVGHLEDDRRGLELLVHDLTSPNLTGARARWRPPRLHESDSGWRSLTVGASMVADLRAPRRLATGDPEGRLVAGPGHHPVVDHRRPTAVAGLDVQFDVSSGDDWSVAPYTDLNHHFGLGTGLHAGLLVHQDVGDRLRVSSRLEYRMLGDHYLPDYFDTVYELTRYRHPHLEDPDTGYPGPKLRAAASTEATTRHGGFGQLQVRIDPGLTLAVAYADATGPPGANLRLRAAFDYEETLSVGVFFHQFGAGDDRLEQLVSLDGALAAAEVRYGLWGPLYAHGQWARQWQLREDGRFDNVRLWKAGLGAGTEF